MRRLIFILLFLFAYALNAQITPISSITTQTTTIGQITYNGTQFDGLNRAIMTIGDVAGNNYVVTNASTNVYLRRNTTDGNANNTSVTFASSGNPNEMLSSYSTTAQSVLLGNNIYKSIDNVFANGTSVSTGNIERVDYLFNGTTGIVATSAMDIAIFERGLANAHDGFNIALITGWNSFTNTPTSFTRITAVTTSDYGIVNVTVDGVTDYSYSYNLFRYNTGDNLTTWTSNTETNTQGIGGIILNWLGLGATNGQTIYGYSIAADDTTTNRNQFVNWSNTTNFPAGSTNGFDPYGANGQIWQFKPVVPEPTTYGVIFIGGCLLLVSALKLWRSRQLA